MSTPLVSVVIPMYKVASLLPSFFERVKQQTYKRLELIFVDDASPDNAAEIVERSRQDLAEYGVQVMLLRHSTNKGVASARNSALDVATGDFIYSWDADDLLEPNGIELLVAEAQRTGADIVGCECYLSYESSKRHLPQPQVSSAGDAFEKICKGIMKWNLWLFLIRRALIEQEIPLRFIPGKNMGEDMMFMGMALLRTRNISIVHKPLYYYVKTNAEAQTQNYTEAQWQQVVANFSALESAVVDHSASDKVEQLQLLKLNLKLPLLLTKNKEDLRRWERLYPEANAFVWANDLLPYRTKFVQSCAAKKQWWLVRMYRLVVMDFLYKILYK